MDEVLIIGGGAAGMMAAYAAAKEGVRATLIEKNEKLGKKLYITGKGRCNLTNMAEGKDFFDSICSNEKFFRSAYQTLNNTETYRLFEEMGLRLKVERGMRVFPESDKSSDVIRSLERQLHKMQVNILLHTEVKEITKTADNVFSVRTRKGNSEEIINAAAVVIATGGLSYPSTGSTGDGYAFAKYFEHKIIPCYPSLVSLILKENVKQLQGLSLKNVSLRMINEQKTVFEGFGEMLFTDKGISGPLVLSASAKSVHLLSNGIRLKAIIDLKPALNKEQLQARLLREFSGNGNKQLKTVLHKLMPASLLKEFIRQTGFGEKKTVSSVNEADMDKLIHVLKNLTFKVTGFGGYPEAVVTKGGISTKEIVPKTMESRLVSGLYFAGEVIDIDALTGGFNLQVAWSTGYTAGMHASQRLKGEKE